MAEPKRKRLPKELQDYKRQIKGLDFMGKVKAYFDCAPYLDGYGGAKKEIVYNSFPRKEKEEFSRRYFPIYSAIDRYGDRLRAINTNCFLYAFYVDTALRQLDTMNYTADLLNLALPDISSALEGMEDGEPRESLKRAQKRLLSYRNVVITAPETKYNSKSSRYEVRRDNFDRGIMEVIEKLKGIITLLKCYLDSLREFLEWVGTPELYPKEFRDIELNLQGKYKPMEIDELQEETRRDFPLWAERSEMIKAYIAIDYDSLPHSVNIFGENNLWAITYRDLFK